MDWQARSGYRGRPRFSCWVSRLALWGLLTVHRSPYFSEVQKLKWLLLVLFLPYLGPLAWILRRVVPSDAEAAQRELEAAIRAGRGSAHGEAGEVAARAE